MSAARTIAEFAAAPQRLSDSVRADALRLLADTLCVGSAGAASAEARRIGPSVEQPDPGRNARRFDGRFASASDAAFFNGFAVHCLEWDAVHEGAVVHALSVVTAALLAKSDERGGSDAEDFLTALAIGVDIASGLGIAATGAMRFFRPATAGVIGAALACARLSNLPREKYADVMGLAYSFAGGTMQAHVEASVALPLQIGHAARSAVCAVNLVEAGMDAPHDVLEGPFGYDRLIEPLDLDRYLRDLGRKWRISEVATKPYPCGRASHGALGELEALHGEGLQTADVERIDLFAPPLIVRLIGRPAKPEMSPAYARLCLPILAPMMLRDGVIDPSLFTPRGLADEELRALSGAVHVHQDGSGDENAMTPQRLVVTCRDERTIERDIAASLGSIDHPMSAAQRRRKYDLCRRLAPASQSRIFDNPLSYAVEPK